MRIIYFLSFILFFNLSFGKNGNDLLVDSKYTIDVNSSWKSNSLKTKQFIAFNKDHNISIGYNKNATVWCWFKIRNRDTKNSIQTWLCLTTIILIVWFFMMAIELKYWVIEPQTAVRLFLH